MKQKFYLFISAVAAMLLSLGTASATVTTVSGKVVDKAGAPLMGAGVVVKGTTNGVITDLDGNYSIKVEDNATLVVSYIGYISQETEVGGRAVINFTLEDDTTTLDDVVVVGYATMKKRDLVGAVDQVGSEVIGNRANSNLTRSLQGEVAGLNITINDSKPSHGGTYNVRGTGSIGAGGSSLVLIDGVEGDLNSVNPQDVASVSVLKDASSTAVYGARGAFGVILVTTKNAQKGRPVINYSGSVSINRRTVIPDGIYDSNEWLDWWKTGYNNYYHGTKALLNHIDSKAPYSEDIYNKIMARKNGDTSIPVAEESYAISGFGYAYYDCHDWMSEFYRDFHLSQEHNLSVSGGNENADYYVSGRYYGSQGVYKIGDESYKKYQLRAKGSLKVRPWMKITNNMSFQMDKNYLPRTQNGNPVGRYMQHCLQPMAPLKNPDGTWTPAAGISGYAAMIEGNNYIQDDYIYLREKADVQIDIIRDVLKLNADYSFNFTNRNRTLVQNMVSYSKSPGVILWENTSSGDGLTNTNYDTKYQAVNVYATWEPKLKWDHTFTALLGYNVEWSNYKYVESKRVGFTTSKPSFNIMDGEATIKQGGSEWSYMGAFIRLNYNIKSRYLFEFSGRYDGSSKFPANQQWGFFPSGSFGWRFSEEPWMQWSRKGLDNGKIRVSAGSMGNGNVDPYKYTSEMTLTKATDFFMAGGLPTYTSVASIVPTSLTWETATTYDVGADLDFLKSRLSASFDYYWRNTTNMYTVGETLPPVYGATAPKGNNASMLTRGWELSLQWRDEVSLGGKPFSYSIKGTLWDSRSFITKFNGNDGKSLGAIGDLINNMGQPSYYEGMEVGEMWGYTVAGLFKDQADIDNSPKQEYKQTVDKVNYPGQVKFADLDGDGKVDYGDLTVDKHGDFSIIGNSSPRYQYGLNFSANWNGIGVSLFFQGVGKRDWYPGADCGYFWGKYARPFFYFVPTAQRLNPVYGEGAVVNPDMVQFDANGDCVNYDTAYWPRPTVYMCNGDKNQTTIMNSPNTRYKQSAAYLRLKNVQIDYSFPEKICKAICISGLKVFANVENAFTITRLHRYAPNLDPEGIWGGDTDFSSPEINGNGYPIFMTATFGINVTF